MKPIPHVSEQSDQAAASTAEEQRRSLADAAALAEQVARIVRDNGLSLRFGSNPREYVFIEGWQAISRVNNEQPHATVKEVVRDPETGDELIHARAWLTDERGTIVSRADGYCSSGESRWRDKPFYARASMAQTRALAKAMRLRHAWVMVMAGYAPTPAEEMSEDLDLRPSPSGRPAEERPAAARAPEPGEEPGVARVAIKAISEKAGKKGDGTPYVRYGIRGSDGAWYNTFSPKFGELARTARESGARATIRYAVTGFGNDILDFALEGDESPEEPPRRE
jgi:hypothetical protein